MLEALKLLKPVERWRLRVNSVKHLNKNTKIYSITIEDLQEVSKEYLGRTFSEKEIDLVSNEIGDFIDWQDSIRMVIDYLKLE
jgi:glutamyl-tRNA reductase